MNKELVEALILSGIKNVCMNIEDYSEILIMNDPRLSVVTLRNVLQTGLYGCLDNKIKIWVSINMPPGFLKFSNQENVASPKELEKWTESVLISDCDSLNRLLKLKAFW